MAFNLFSTESTTVSQYVGNKKLDISDCFQWQGKACHSSLVWSSSSTHREWFCKANHPGSEFRPHIRSKCQSSSWTTKRNPAWCDISFVGISTGCPSSATTSNVGDWRDQRLGPSTKVNPLRSWLDQHPFFWRSTCILPLLFSVAKKKRVSFQVIFWYPKFLEMLFLQAFRSWDDFNLFQSVFFITQDQPEVLTNPRNALQEPATASLPSLRIPPLAEGLGHLSNHKLMEFTTWPCWYSLSLHLKKMWICNSWKISLAFSPPPQKNAQSHPPSLVLPAEWNR